MSPSATPSPLRQILETRITQLSSEMETLFAEARERGRRESADQLNQAVRRIRQATDLEELGSTFFDAAAGFATGAALFYIHGSSATGERIRGVDDSTAESFNGIEIPLQSAAALAGAVESRDPMVAVSTPAEVSAEMVRLVGHKPDGRVWIFPVALRDKVPVVLYTWGNAQGPALELLSQVAAAVWAGFSKPPAPPVADLVQIAPPSGAPPPSPPAQIPAAAQPRPAWENLDPLDQKRHLRAQRFARVQTAEMRLREADTVQAGRAQKNLYSLLRKPIDAAREKFRKSFLPCASMVDYLHLEFVRTLAHEDPELLGPDYPGPLV